MNIFLSMAAEQNRKLDKYDKTFESVLSSADSEFLVEGKSKSVTKAKMGIKRRNKNSEKTNLDSKKGVKKKKESAKDRMLEMNSFYCNNSFGIWIQCTKCNKWRKVMEYEEEHEVPEDWCCSMNMSGTRSCDEPEDTKHADFSPVNFIPGAIVWAKFSGYPWWPGMIEDDPDVEEYYWLEKNGKCAYHVTFLDDKVTRAWVPASLIRHYFDPPKYRGLGARYSKYSPLIAEAEIKARKAITMPIQQRLKNFSFAHLYKGKWGSPLRCGSSDESEGEGDLTQMLLEEISDIESAKSSDSDYRSVSSFDEQKKNEADKESDDCRISLKDNLANNIECKKNEINKNTLLPKTQLKKENKSPNEDDTADFKVEEIKPLNKQTNEKKLHLSEVIPNVTETENSKPLISQKAKEAKHLKSIKKKIPIENKNISISVETLSEDCLAKDSSKNKKTKALIMKTSKTMNKARKLKNFDENVCNTKEDEEETKSSSLEKHNEDAKIVNLIKKENSRGKNNSFNSKFKPPLKNNKNYAGENSPIGEGMEDAETAANINLHNTDSVIKEQKHEENEMDEKHVEENKQLNETNNSACISVKKRAFKNGNKTVKENVKSQNKLKKKNVVKMLENHLKGSLENKSASLQENENHANNDSSTTPTETLTAEDKMQDKKPSEKNNLAENLSCSEVQDNGKNCIKRSKKATSISQQKGKIMRRNSLTHNLSVSASENSKLVNASKFLSRQTGSKKETKKIKTSEAKNEKEDMKQKQENEIICISDDDNSQQSDNDMEQENTYNDGTDKENFSLSVKMNLQESEEEDSDPFEAE